MDQIISITQLDNSLTPKHLQLYQWSYKWHSQGKIFKSSKLIEYTVIILEPKLLSHLTFCYFDNAHLYLGRHLFIFRQTASGYWMITFQQSSFFIGDTPTPRNFFTHSSDIRLFGRTGFMFGLSFMVLTCCQSVEDFKHQQVLFLLLNLERYNWNLLIKLWWCIPSNTDCILYLLTFGQKSQ